MELEQKLLKFASGYSEKWKEAESKNNISYMNYLDQRFEWFVKTQVAPSKAENYIQIYRKLKYH